MRPTRPQSVRLITDWIIWDPKTWPRINVSDSDRSALLSQTDRDRHPSLKVELQHADLVTTVSSVSQEGSCRCMQKTSR